MNASRAFFDTNILLYVYSDDVTKQPQAKELFEQHAMADRLLISTQVVQEFWVNGLRKLHIPAGALKQITDTLLKMPLILIGPPPHR